MIFTNFSRLQQGETIILYNEFPIENVGKIKYYNDDADASGFSKREFRWSFNNEHWSGWQPLTQKNISFIETYENYYFFLQIRYVLSGENTANVTSFTLNYINGNATPLTPRILTNDIQSQDASAIIIHDIIQSYEITKIYDASLLHGYSGSYYLNRSNHIGMQPISSVSDLQGILNNTIKLGNVPTSTSYVGTTGSISFDSSYLYICVSTNTWGRVSLDFTF
jgi:hypothetical protein